jgi:hypothetical protein
MKLYEKYTLDCNDLIRKYCTILLSTQWDYRSEIIFRIPKDASFMPVLEEEMQRKNLPRIRAVSIFCRGPNNIQPPHIDTRDNEFSICSSGFYIPLITLDSRLIWLDPKSGFRYKVNVSPNINSNKVQTVALMVLYRKGYESHIIGEYNSHDPVIINTSIPHSAISNKYPRAAIAIRLHDNVDLFEHFNLRP